MEAGGKLGWVDEFYAVAEVVEHEAFVEGGEHDEDSEGGHKQGGGAVSYE